MSTTSVDFRYILDHDHIPLIVFDSGAKILYLNTEAEILLSYVDKKEIFDTAMIYAAKDFGSKTTIAEIDFRQFSFYGINVCYKDDEWIAVRLYHKSGDKKIKVDRSKLRQTDINILLSTAMRLFEMSNDTKLTLLTDRELPQLKADQNALTKLVGKILERFAKSDEIEVSTTMALGESMVLDGKRYPILRLRVTGNRHDPSRDDEIQNYAKSLCMVYVGGASRTELDIPVIQ